MLPNDADSAPGVQGWVSMPVCTQEDGTEGVLDFYGTSNKGCVTANALCCGGSESQCLVDKSNQFVSQIGSVTVPCGVNMSYSYDGKCDFTDTTVTHVVGSGIPKVLEGDTTTNTTFPYSFQFSLAPGYKCDNGDLVIASNNKKPCVHGGSNVSFTTHGARDGGFGGLSKKDILIALGVTGVVVIILFYVFVNHKSRTMLTVKQIVARAGINEHLVVPGQSKPHAVSKPTARQHAISPKRI